MYGFTSFSFSRTKPLPHFQVFCQKILERRRGLQLKTKVNIPKLIMRLENIYHIPNEYQCDSINKLVIHKMYFKLLGLILGSALSIVNCRNGKYFAIKGLDKNQNYYQHQADIKIDSISLVCPMCFVSVTSFGGMYFRAFLLPVLLRRTVLVIATDEFWIQKIFHVLPEFLEKLGNSSFQINPHPIPDLCFSKYFHKEHNLNQHAYCTKLLRDNLTVSSRPWNNELHIVLHPTIFDVTLKPFGFSEEEIRAANLDQIGIKM